MPAAARPKSSEQLGQVLVVGFDGTEMSPRLYDLLTRLQPAGVILFARNIEGAQQTHKLLKDCQACVRVPLFTCVDLEGGKVDRFRKITGSAPSAAEVFAPIAADDLRPVLADVLLWYEREAPESDDAILNAGRALRFAREGVWLPKPALRAWAAGQPGTNEEILACTIAELEAG